MKRRTALGVVVAGFSATAGCLDFLPSRSDDFSSGSRANEPPSGDGTGDSPSEGKDGTSGSSATIGACPSSSFSVADTSAQRVVCNGKQTDTEIYLTAESNTVSLPSGTIDFTLRNLTGRSKLYPPCQWVLYKRTSEGWKTVHSLKEEAIEKTLLGGFATLTLYVGKQPATDTGRCPYVLESPTPGRYLFGITGILGRKETLYLASFRVVK